MERQGYDKMDASKKKDRIVGGMKREGEKKDRELDETGKEMIER